MNLPKLQSITKKIFVALLGAFLLIFLLFHAGANLCILRHDDGTWYSAFCHFMGTNYVVRVFEYVLLLTFLAHIVLTLWLWITNKQARPVSYRRPSRTKTHKGSKLQVWTGILILALLVVHFCDFYFVKLGLVEGKYMAKTEDVMTDEVRGLRNAAMQYGMQPEEFANAYASQIEQMMAQASSEEQAKAKEEIEKIKAAVNVVKCLDNVEESGDYIKGINVKAKESLVEAGIHVEPDFYRLTREKFKNPIMALLYLIFFVIVWFHMRHAFAAFFQTMGWYNYKYGKAIEVCSSVYAWLVCLCFTAVVVLVFVGL